MLSFHHVAGVSSGDMHLFVPGIDCFRRRMNIFCYFTMEVFLGLFWVKCRMGGRFIGDSGFDQK
jgi:hypothetical protein